MSLARGSEISQKNTKSTNIPKMLHDQRNKQIQFREEIKVSTYNMK